MIQIQSVYTPLYTNTDKFITIISGGRGSAKSFNVTTFIERLTFEKGHKILFSRYTMASAGISIIPEFVDKIERDGTSNYFQITKNEIINTFSGSQVLFKGIKTSSGNQTANLKSIQGITTFVGDEMEEWHSQDDFEKLLLSIREKDKQLLTNAYENFIQECRTKKQKATAYTGQNFINELQEHLKQAYLKTKTGEKYPNAFPRI